MFPYRRIIFLYRVVQSYGSIIISLLSKNKHNYCASTRKHKNHASLRKQKYYASMWKHFYMTLTESKIAYMYMRIYSDSIFIDNIYNKFIRNELSIIMNIIIL